MKINKKLILYFVVLFVILWLLSGWLKLDFGKSEYDVYLQEPASFSSGWLINVTGEILTSPDKQNWNRWREYAMQSEKFFYGWLYLISKREAKDLMKTLAGKWVDVQLLLENRQYKDYGKSRKHINDDLWGVSWLQIKSDEHLWLNFNHTKTFVSDKYTFIQSANLTHSAFAKNVEHFFVTENQDIRNNLINLFANDWNGELFGPEDIHPNLLVCPIDCRAKLTQMIEQAKESIYVYHQYLKDDKLTTLLQKKINEWLDIRLVLSDTESNYLLLRDWWSEYVSIQKKPYVHTKILVIDNQYAVLGSMNLSKNALDNNREIGIILTDKVLVEKLVGEIK